MCYAYQRFTITTFHDDGVWWAKARLAERMSGGIARSWAGPGRADRAHRRPRNCSVPAGRRGNAKAVAVAGVAACRGTGQREEARDHAPH